jgi:NhaP-type Na+/H+ and K+/H+ antiporter
VQGRNPVFGYMSVAFTCVALALFVAALFSIENDTVERTLFGATVGSLVAAALSCVLHYLNPRMK